MQEQNGAVRGAQTFSIETLLIGFAAWTVGHWVTLALGLGWVFALAVAIIASLSVVAVRRRATTTARGRPCRDAELPTPDTAALALMFAFVIAWPLILRIGRGPLAVAAVVLLVARVAIPVVRDRWDGRDLRLLGALAVATATTFAFRTSWALVVVLVGLIGIAAIIWPTEPSRPNGPVDDERPASRFDRPWIASLLLGAFGVVLAVWHIGASFWASDNAGYLNKAQAYADEAFTSDYHETMYGISDLLPVQIGNELSGFEPMLGLVAGLTGLRAYQVLFVIVAPLFTFLIPFAARYAAHGLGIRRSNLAGAAAASSILLMTASPTTNLFAFAGYGKTIGQLVFIPILFGAMGALQRHPDGRTATTAILAGIGAVSSSPSVAIGGALVVAAFSAPTMLRIAVAVLRRTSLDRPRAALGLSPLLFMAVYTVVARQLQSVGGDAQTSAGFRSFATPESAWTQQFGASSDQLLAVFFLLGAAVALPLAVPGAAMRRSAGLLMIGVFSILLSPWGFDHLIGDVLDLNHFAWRFFWALPAAALIGMVVASVEVRTRLSLLTVTATLIGFGLSGPTLVSFFRTDAVEVWNAPLAWPWETGIPEKQLETAEAVIDATPTGGRYLAAPTVEEVASAIQTDRYPTYNRLHYIEIIDAGHADNPDLEGDHRVLLALGISGRLERDVTDAQWTTALDAVEVDTVCMTARTEEGLRAAVTSAYVDAGSAGTCDLWVRSESALE